MITKSEFDLFEPDSIFEKGIAPNSPEGLFMTRSGGYLNWVAVKGFNNDWSMYCHYAPASNQFVREHGQKVIDMDNIRRVLSVDDEVAKRYRF